MTETARFHETTSGRTRVLPDVVSGGSISVPGHPEPKVSIQIDKPEIEATPLKTSPDIFLGAVYRMQNPQRLAP
jgi:hypothetical protein